MTTNQDDARGAVNGRNRIHGPCPQLARQFVPRAIELPGARQPLGRGLQLRQVLRHGVDRQTGDGSVQGESGDRAEYRTVLSTSLLQMMEFRDD